MASTGLFGPHKLDQATIDTNVSGKGAGVYALDRSTQGNFTVHYVGRSDDDLPSRLKKHIGKYAYFKYGYFKTAKDAFEKECHLYHDFSPPDNTIHPARPKGTNYNCPVSGCNELD